MNDEALAAMYPSMVAAPTAETATLADEFASPELAAKAANAMFPSMSKPAELPPEELSPEVQALRDQEPARKMFKDEVMYGTALEAVTSELEPEEKALATREWAGIMADLALPPAEAQNLVGLATAHAYPTEELAAQWQTSATDALLAEFGEDANAALDAAKLLVARDPRLAAFLDETGLGSHPEFVLQAARIARSQIMSGRLKRRG